MKKTLLPLALACMALMGYSQTVPQLSKDGVDLYIGLHFDHTWPKDVFTTDSAGIYRLPAGYDSKLPVISPLMVGGGVTYNAGKVYVNSYDDTDGFEWTIVPQWQIYDLRTGTLEKSIDLPDNYGGLTSSLTYDISSDVIYGVGRNNDGLYLAKIDPETGDRENMGFLAESGERIYRSRAIVADRYGLLYIIYEANGVPDVPRFGRVNKNNGEIAYIDDIVAEGLLTGSMGSDQLVTMDGHSALVCNHDTNKIYWLMTSSSLYVGDYYMPMFEMNVSTGKAAMVGYLAEGNAVSGAFFNEPSLTAPECVTDFAYNVSDDSDDLQTGRFTMTAPLNDYDSNALTGTLTLVVEENGEVVVSLENVAPGATVSTDEMTLAYGEHDFTCYAVNSDGEKGVYKDFSVFAGYDLPYAPSNVKLSVEGLKLTLTWDAPTYGIHGKPIDPSGITYRIVRYPGDILEEDFTGTTYTEEIPEDLYRYTYMIVSRYKGQDGYAILSNSVIGGLPLDVPYSFNFYDEEEMYNSYKVIDGNGDFSSWTYYEGSALYFYNEVNDADDWLFAPPINYEAGHKYRLTVNVNSSHGDYPEHLAITFGNDDEVAAQSVVLDIPKVPLEHTDYSVVVTPDESGVHFFGFHALSPALSGYLYLRYLEIVDVTGSGIEDVSAGDGVDIVAGDGVVSVTNPDGYDITIYNIGGMVVASSSQTRFETMLESGVYVVKCGSNVQKVIVK